jgi:CBS domain-containing protein
MCVNAAARQNMGVTPRPGAAPRRNRGWPLLGEMIVLVKDIMTRGATIVGPDFPLATAARLMRDHDIGCLFVVEDERLVGVLTDRDILVRGVAEALDPIYNVVRHAMSAGATVCLVDDTIHQARRLMIAKRVKQLPVLDRRDRLVGSVSISELTALVGESVEGANVKVERAELPAEDQPVPVNGRASEPPRAAPRRPTFSHPGQDLGNINSAHRGSSAPGRSPGRAESPGS